MAIMDILVPILTGGIGAAGGVYATRTQAVADDRDDDRDDVKTVDERWQKMFEQQRAHLDAVLEPMAKRVGALESKVSMLEGALETLRRLFRSAIDHIRELRARWPIEVAPLPPLPHDLTDEV